MTRKPYTNQEAFDVAARHLLTQGQLSAHADGTCQYRGPDGRKCAIGALIDDADYTPGMDASAIPVSHLAERGLLPAYLAAVDEALLIRLQRTHDIGDIAAWSDRLRSIAAKHNLSPAVLDEVST